MTGEPKIHPTCIRLPDMWRMWSGVTALSIAAAFSHSRTANEPVGTDLRVGSILKSFKTGGQIVGQSIHKN